VTHINPLKVAKHLAKCKGLLSKKEYLILGGRDQEFYRQELDEQLEASREILQILVDNRKNEKP